MHYKDGQAAQVGDLVNGPAANGKMLVQGVVARVKRNIAAGCDVQVAYLDEHALIYNNQYNDPMVVANTAVATCSDLELIRRLPERPASSAIAKRNAALGDLQEALEALKETF